MVDILLGRIIMDSGNQLDTNLAKETMLSGLIEDGQFFVMANKWYNIKYLYPYTQALWTLIMVLLLGITVLVVGSILNMQYTSKKIPFSVYIDNQVDYISYIRPLAGSYESTNISIARYLVSYYVKLRESYNPTLLDESSWQSFFNQIQALSSRRVFSEFVRYMDTQSNPQSPVLLYRTTFERVINEIQIIFPEGDYNKPDTATVYFKAIARGRESSETKNWKAEITFDMSDMSTGVQNKLYFTVIKYITEPMP